MLTDRELPWAAAIISNTDQERGVVLYKAFKKNKK